MKCWLVALPAALVVAAHALGGAQQQNAAMSDSSLGPPDTASLAQSTKLSSDVVRGAAHEGGDSLTPPRRQTKSTALAMLLSAVLPGAGQTYNESYWKVPIVLGFGIYFGSQWLHNNRLVDEYRDRYTASISPSLTSGDTRLLTIRDFYKDQRDTFAWYFVILYLLNIADAYVDAALYDFNVSDDLSIRFIPDRARGFVLRITF